MGIEFADNKSMKEKKIDKDDYIYEGTNTKPRSILGKRTMSSKSKSKKVFSSKSHQFSTPIYC
jgi:hypothetical protein